MAALVEGMALQKCIERLFAAVEGFQLMLSREQFGCGEVRHPEKSNVPHRLLREGCPQTQRGRGGRAHDPTQPLVLFSRHHETVFFLYDFLSGAQRSLQHELADVHVLGFGGPRQNGFLAGIGADGQRVFFWRCGDCARHGENSHLFIMLQRTPTVYPKG